MSFLFIIVEITCQYIPKFKMSLVTDKEIENFTLAVIQSEQLLQNNCIRITGDQLDGSVAEMSLVTCLDVLIYKCIYIRISSCGMIANETSGVDLDKKW